MSYLSIYW